MHYKYNSTLTFQWYNMLESIQILNLNNVYVQKALCQIIILSYTCIQHKQIQQTLKSIYMYIYKTIYDTLHENIFSHVRQNKKV